MDKQEVTDAMKVEITNELVKLRNRLVEQVVAAYQQRGKEFGDQRFSAWQRALNQSLKKYLPRSIRNYNQLFSPFEIYHTRHGESDDAYFCRTTGIKVDSFLDSLILDIQNNEYDFAPINKEVKQMETTPKAKSNKVFIVHGHDGHVKERTARFIEKLGFEAIILHEQVNKSRTIIEKIEDYSDVTDFAIVLYTPDDLGVVKTKSDDLQPRARQNVIFEHGFLMGKLGRENVVPLVEGDIELPNDISGIVYVSEGWEMKIAQEMHEAGYDVDFNKLIKNNKR
jgi:predicted nucleotide-binding protein